MSILWPSVISCFTVDELMMVFLYCVSDVIFYLITTGCLLHEISNDGAREEFEKYLDTLILPEMVSCAKVSVAVYCFLGQCQLVSVSCTLKNYP